jgi:predicted MFS family arabinose efflux permease
MASSEPLDDTATHAETSAAPTLLMAATCGIVAGNLYYAQPLAGLIGADLGLSAHATGLVVTLTQIGYGVGLLFIVPLGDLVENRRLILITIALATLGLIGAAVAPSATPFLAASLLIGLGSVAIQVVVPFAAHLAPEAIRGQVVGNVMSGLMLGIMLARPVSSFVAELLSWRAIFVLSIAAMVALSILLRTALPRRRPAAELRYGELLGSMATLMLRTRVLQRRALYQACMFGAFSLFWTTTPLLLGGPDFRLTQGGIALFALAGVAGAVATPIGGRLADRGWTRPATAAAMLMAAGAFLLTHLAPLGSTASLALLVVAAILLDFAVAANLTLGQRAIYVLGAAYRARLNGLFMATFFTGGAIGSAAGGWAFAQGGWTYASWLGFALPVAALAFFATERRPAPPRRG